MKQVRIKVTCDACAAWHEAEVEEGVQTVTVSAQQTLDLCPSHRTDLAPLLALIAEWGASPSGRRTSSRRSSTPNGVTLPSSAPVAPEQPSNAATKRGGKRARQRRANAQQQHQPAVVADHPPCPLCQHPAPSGKALSDHLRQVHHTSGAVLYGGTCPLCAAEGTAQGLGSHAGRAHGISGVAALFAAADAQGDPHGIVAGRAQALAAAASA